MPKIDPVPDSALQSILTPELFRLWEGVLQTVDSLYDMEKEWHTGGKAAQYELKFRRGGKTLVSLFPREDSIGLMIIFGRAEREKFEAREAEFPAPVTDEYHKAATYHDGKWILFRLPDAEVEGALPALLSIKRRPNRK